MTTLFQWHFPTFPNHKAIVNFVIIPTTGAGYESHWVPYSRYCTPCSVTYDVVGKLETAADDFRVHYMILFLFKQNNQKTK